jgi:hypothetical protein
MLAPFFLIPTQHEIDLSIARARRAWIATERGRCARTLSVPVGTGSAAQ